MINSLLAFQTKEYVHANWLSLLTLPSSFKRPYLGENKLAKESSFIYLRAQ